MRILIKYEPPVTYSKSGVGPGAVSYSVRNMPAEFEYANSHINTEIIPANDSIEYSYYLNPRPSEIIIKLTTDKPIKRLSKTKLFPTHFSKSD